MTRLSVVIITHNEETNLARCLESVRFADEIIMADSHSTDRTVEIASQFGARTFTIEWSGFGPAKQFAVDQATGEWILSIDADEALSAELAEEIKGIIAGAPSCDGFDMPRLTNFLGRWIRHCGWYPDRVARLFRKGRGRFTDATVHESLVVDGPVGHCRRDLLHYSYPTLEIYFEKFNRYTTMGAEQALARGERSGLFDLTIRPAAAFVKHYISKAGLLDGMEGLMISVLSSCAVFIKYAKLRQLQRKAGK
ncbi:MAG: glycosyltransferase family 2 protein [candidate division Zixibacteria bacterium]|nr:glycosyltransferase family 2 protein [candidate division Zixibacteria bacterium]